MDPNHESRQECAPQLQIVFCLQQDISAFRIATSGQFGQDRFSNMKLHCILACSVVLIFGHTHQARSAHLQSFLAAGMPILDKILNAVPCQDNFLQERRSNQMDMSRKIQILNDVLLQHGSTAAVSCICFNYCQ